MQKHEGEYAGFYNIRKQRSGAIWEGRYECTMIDGCEHLWRCMKYNDLNMVRAGVVRHPSEWPWCGYGELLGTRQQTVNRIEMDVTSDAEGTWVLKESRISYG